MSRTIAPSARLRAISRSSGHLIDSASKRLLETCLAMRQSFETSTIALRRRVSPDANKLPAVLSMRMHLRPAAHQIAKIRFRCQESESYETSSDLNSKFLLFSSRDSLHDQ